MMGSWFGWMLAGAYIGLIGADARGQTEVLREDYRHRLRGMWLAESIANWTGLRGEGRRTNPPFATDADWGSDLGRGPLIFVLDPDPWGADDDTDIEYVYAYLMRTTSPRLSAQDVTDGWIEHINRFIWVSNEQARELMEQGVRAPATGLPAANQYWPQIDAQLTTEVFGAVAPGMPGLALELADLPIRTTSGGHASHASQFHAVLYALAPLVDKTLAPNQQTLWLVQEARRWVPDSSKAADIVDFVTAEFLANPDKDNWEQTRDRIYERYHGDATQHGFKYRGWTESSVNFATSIMCFLYGQGDLRRTIQIGTLSGWDADNPTATMGGLLGLINGDAWVEAQFPEATLSDRYWISRTRDGMPDHLPADPDAEDTFTLLADRMLTTVDRALALGGARRHDRTGDWLVPPLPASDPLARNPRAREFARSHVHAVRAAGGSVTGASSVTSSPTSGGVGSPAYLANGFNTDFSGVDPLNDSLRRYYSTQNAGASPGDWQTLTITFDRDVLIGAVRFIEGDHFHDTVEGGWFEEAHVEVRVDGQWVQPGASPSEPLDPTSAFQTLDFTLDAPVLASGARIVGRVGGAQAFVTCAELDALTPPSEPPVPGFDVDRNSRVDIEDLYSWYSQPVDLSGDGVADAVDQSLVAAAVRWREVQDMTAPRRPSTP
ncbi:MAG: ADP-ribosylglycohydrolase family protein [Phycisphaeraceae bacterium]|nr:ADP-ribosylglycohydrolase family protein [Phycisphaeraceae bacterium]